VFVAALDPNEFYREGIAQQIAPPGPLVGYAIDCEHSKASARIGAGSAAGGRTSR
jgi:hypothetical protein